VLQLWEGWELCQGLPPAKAGKLTSYSGTNGQPGEEPAEGLNAVIWPRHYTTVEDIPKGENGRENPLTIFSRISFYSVGNGNGKVRKKIRSVKSGPSKTDKSKQKCPGIDRQMVI
jgi:hypothetical protein